MSQDKITTFELKALMATKKIIIIDVRSVTEFGEGHLWSSVNRPVDGLPGSVSDLSKDSQIVTVCNKGGGRSERAAGILRAAGWSRAQWLEGGYLGWIEAGMADYEPGFASS